MYLFLPSYIKDIAEAILVLLVVGNFIFQPINETLRLWMIRMILQECIHRGLHRLIIVLYPTRFRKRKVSVRLIACHRHLMNFVLNGIYLREIILNPTHVLRTFATKPGTFGYGDKASRLQELPPILQTSLVPYNEDATFRPNEIIRLFFERQCIH